MAMKHIDVRQRSPEWLIWRANGITATDLPVILGVSPYKTPWQLFAEKTGLINQTDISGNPFVQRGNALEDTARQKVEAHTGELLFPLCGECLELPILRASFDGMDSQNKPHELKVPHPTTLEEIETNQIESSTYILYEAQVETQCVVAGVSEGLLSFYREEGEDIEFVITLTDTRRTEILNAAKYFWNLVQTNTAPQADPAKDWFIPDSIDEQFKWDAYADAWRSQHQCIKSLKENLKLLEAEQKDIQQQLITLMGPYRHADMGGVKIARFEKKGTIDYTAFFKDTFPDQNYSDKLELFRKAPHSEARFTKSEDELVNLEARNTVITTVKSAYF